jgi:hypothetical protein
MPDGERENGWPSKTVSVINWLKFLELIRKM